jgi:hypothetical protein
MIKHADWQVAAQRRMNMKLLYNNTCPSDYEPPGFHTCNDQTSLITSNRGTEIGSMDTSFHGWVISQAERVNVFLI